MKLAIPKLVHVVEHVESKKIEKLTKSKERA
jgi:hypothetical protein